MFQSQKSRPPSSFLGTSKSYGDFDIPVTKVELEHGISSGVFLTSLANGLVPVYEEHLARLERGIDLDTWAEMKVDEKALVIAVRRVTLAMNNLQAEAEIRKAKKG